MDERTKRESDTPLVVDLDGTLIKTDSLHESLVRLFSREPIQALRTLLVLSQGRAAFKAAIADRILPDPSTAPVDAAVLTKIEQAREEGRKVYLATAADRRCAEAFANKIGTFDGVFASEGGVNLKGQAKADRLVAAFGAHGFDYIGNDAADLPVWSKAARAISVRASERTRRRLANINSNNDHIPSAAPNWRTWMKQIRVHQYAKNTLVFVPLFTAHQFAPRPLLQATLAALAFCLCASSAYILNDLVDLEADRGFASKRDRPLASGAIPLTQGVAAMIVLLAASLAIALSVSFYFLGVLLVYLALTVSYSFWLKRKMLVDVIALAMLYTMRVVGGTVAIDVEFSEWLLAFSMFIFMALALIKRYVELAVRLDANLPDPPNRNYKVGDLGVIMAIAAAAGFNAVIVFALYISSERVHELYSRPLLLWLVCPVLMYWISRALLMAHRRFIHDDPVIFALTDKVSRLTIILIGLLVLAAI